MKKTLDTWIIRGIGLCLLVVGVPGQSLWGQVQPKVLLIGLDGLRPDALQAAQTQTLDSLFSTGTYSLDPLLPQGNWNTVSAPGWTSVLTGVWPDQHGVTSNQATLVQTPSIFSLLAQYRPDLQTAAFFSAPTIAWIDTFAATYQVATHPNAFIRDDSSFQSALTLIEQGDPDMIFLHLVGIDHAGHVFGYHPDEPDYLAQIELADNRIDMLTAAIINRPNYLEERWVIVVATDHGGIDNVHFHCSREERQVFVGVFDLGKPGSGPCFDQGELTFPELPVCDSMHIEEALHFNGEDGYLLVDGFGEEGYSAGLTLETWIRPDKGWLPKYDGDQHFTLGGYFHAQNVFKKVRLHYDLLAEQFSYFDFTLFAQGGSLVGPEAFLEDQWYHLALSIDSTNVVKLYINAQLIASDTTGQLWLPDDQSSLIFGARVGNGNVKSDFFEGELGEMRLWNRALSQSTLQTWLCMPLDSTHVNWGNLQGWWLFESDNIDSQGPETNDEFFADFSGKGNTAVLYDSNGTNSNPLLLSVSQGPVVKKIESYQNVPQLVDIAPTILKLLGLSPPLGLTFAGTAIEFDSACAPRARYHFSPGIDTVFTDYFRQPGLAWNGGDASISIGLPDGRILWLFGDSYLDVLDSVQQNLPCFFNVNNSLVVQDGHDLSLLSPLYDSAQIESFFDLQIPGTRLWPGHGYVYQDTVHIFLLQWDDTLALQGIFLAKLDYPGLNLQNIRPLPFNKLIQWGRSVWIDSIAQMLYVYGHKGIRPYLARCGLDDPYDSWGFFDGNSWQSDELLAQPISNIPVSSTYSVVQLQDSFYLFTQQVGFLTCGLGREAYVYQSAHPHGIFSDPDTLFTIVDKYGAEFVNTYNAYAHPHLIQQNQLLLSYNVNDNANVATCPQQCAFQFERHPDTYRPKFFRVPLSQLGIQTSIDQPDSFEGKLALFPNPTSGSLTLQLELATPQRVQYEIRGLTGQLIMKGNFHGASKHLNLDKLATGLYVIRVHAAGRQTQRKIIRI